MPTKKPFHRDDDTESFDDITVKRETEKAILVEVDGEEVWIPKSQIHDDSEVYKAGTTGRLIVTRWIAEQKGLV